jgi:hypothetical protein
LDEHAEYRFVVGPPAADRAAWISLRAVRGSMS